MNESVYFLVTFIVDILAILLAVIFYLSANKAEKEAAKLLTEIKTQAQTISRLTARWVDKSFDYFTQRPTATDDSLIKLSDLVSQTQTTILHTLQVYQPQPKNNSQEVESMAILLLEALSKVNYFAQGYLPQFDIFDSKNNLHAFYKYQIDQSYSDYMALKKALTEPTSKSLSANPNYATFQNMMQYWDIWVRNSEAVFLAKRNVVN